MEGGGGGGKEGEKDQRGTGERGRGKGSSGVVWRLRREGGGGGGGIGGGGGKRDGGKKHLETVCPEGEEILKTSKWHTRSNPGRCMRRQTRATPVKGNPTDASNLHVRATSCRRRDTRCRWFVWS